ncbi:MAG: hypothetical protein H6710_00035 [Myxococcales bacterium]|nr:hypothetical protein [Myxococcales bacterium]
MSGRASPIGIPLALTLLPYLAEAPEPPPCPDYGFPAYPRANRNRCAEPWIAIYDVPCTDEAVECLLFRKRHYVWRQSRLLAFLHRRPASSDSALAKYNWCSDVLQLVLDLADDTNLQRQFLSHYDVPDIFSRTRAVLAGMRPAKEGRALSLMFPELWLTGAGNELVPPSRSMLGYHVLGYFDDVDAVRGAYLHMPDGRTTSVLLEHVRAAHAAVKPRPIPTAWPALGARGGVRGEGGAAPPTAATSSIARAQAAGRNVTARDLSLAIIEAAPRPGQFLSGAVERATGGAPCLSGPASRDCFTYEWMPVAIAGAEWTMDLLAAHAEDWLAAPYDAVLNAGFQRYLAYLQPYAERGTLALSPEELAAQAEEAARREAQAWTGTTLATVAGVAALMGPVGQVAAAIIAVIGAILQVLLEVLPLARGDGDCPVLGFRRTIPDGDCAAPEPQGHPEFVASVRRYREVALTGHVEGVVSRDASSGDGTGGQGASGESHLLLWGLGAAAVGTLALVGVAAARKRRRRQRALEAPRADFGQDFDDDEDDELEADDLEPSDEREST